MAWAFRVKEAFLSSVVGEVDGPGGVIPPPLSMLKSALFLFMLAVNCLVQLCRCIR